MHPVTLNGSDVRHAEKIKLRIAELDSLKIEVEQQLTDLENAVAPKPEPGLSEDRAFAKSKRATFDKSVETRCQNLRATLNDIKRWRLAAKIELAVLSQD